MKTPQGRNSALTNIKKQVHSSENSLEMKLDV